MAIKNTLLGGTDWVSEPINSADLNDTINVLVPGVKIIGSIYTGTGFDNSNHTIQLSASDLSNAAYVEINITFSSSADGSAAGTDGSVTLQVERQETGSGAGFTDILPTTYVLRVTETGGTSTVPVTILNTIKLIVATTADERTNGIDIKFTSVEAGTGADFQNKQTWFRGISI